MGSDKLDELRAQALEHVNEGRVDEACRAFQELVTREPEVPEGWINLATAERALGQLHASAEHYRTGIDLLEKEGLPPEDRGLLASALHALGSTYEALERTADAAAAYRDSAKRDPRAPTPLASLTLLLARAGELQEAARVANEYCLSAVSVLAEKANIPVVRRFQKIVKQAETVDGNLVLVATREAYVRGFEQTLASLPSGVQIEAEPQRRSDSGELVPLLPNPARPWSRVRFDAIEPVSGERWMIQDSPTYGYPKESAAACEMSFSVPLRVTAPFPVLLATRTAWDYFFVRLRFVHGLREQTIERAEAALGAWYLKGFEGAFREGPRGHFHFLSEPFAIAAEGLRYEVDLGLAQLDAVPALLEALAQLHRDEPIEIAVLGDGALPPAR